MRILILTIISTVMVTPQVYANDMINNTAVGYVEGSIIQTVEDGAVNVINVGSIIGENIDNVDVYAAVRGDIAVHAESNSETKLSIGSIEGE